jgi:predicted small lipoprotein YifL
MTGDGQGRVQGWTALLLLSLAIAGCGVMGPPVPPNSIGVNVKRHNDTVERERRLQATQTRQDRQELGATPHVPTERALSPSEEILLRGNEVQPSARPDSDFLVRPR